MRLSCKSTVLKNVLVRNFGTCQSRKFATISISRASEKDESDYHLLTRHPNALPTYYFQKSLPRLPVPKLELTVERYLESQIVLLNPNEYAEVEKITKEFEMGEGKKLHEELIERDKAMKHTSYISAPWFDMYLKDRQPLPINYNPALIYVEDKEIDALPLNRRQLVRATNIIISSMRFMNSLESELLEPEVFHMNPKKSDTTNYRKIMKFCPNSYATYCSYLMKAYPLDMSQFASLFRSTRLPQKDKDKLERQSEDSKHIVVLKNGNFYVFPVFDNDGNILSTSEIMGSLESIIMNNEPVAETPIGLLTTENRNTWADVRSHIFSLSQKNEESLKEIDSALLVVSLDDNFGSDYAPLVKHFLHSDGKNRWFDKSFNLIVSKEGWAGLTFEHAWGDGVAVMRFFNDVLKDNNEKNWANASEPKRPIIAPIKLRESFWVLFSNKNFDVDDKIKSAIQNADKRYKCHTESLQLNPFLFDKFGKKKCKSWGVSPDAMMQLGFQVAFKRVYGHTPPSYESCSTSAFKHGRTETIRPATSLTKEISEIMSKNDWQSRTKELHALFKTSSDKHNELVKNAAMGQGFDRHLFAMKNIAQMKGNIPRLFMDEKYVNLNLNVISSSTLSSPAVRAGGFGPVVPDGFGIGYQIWDDGLGSIITSYKGRRDGDALSDAFNATFSDFETVLSSKS